MTQELRNMSNADRVWLRQEIRAAVRQVLNEEFGEVMQFLRAVKEKGDVTTLREREELRSVIRMVIYNGAIRINVLNAQKCPECGKVFTQSRSDQVYCGKKCRDRVAAREYRERRRQNEVKNISVFP